MAAVAPLSLGLVSPSKSVENVLFGRYTSNGSDYGLSDVHSSPGTCPQTPESFVVTPDGKALPGIRELHVDDAGYLHIVDRAPEHLDDSIYAESPPVVRPRKAAPRLDFQQHMHTSAWLRHPQIAWRKQIFNEDEDRRSVRIFVVDREGTARVRTVPARVYERQYVRDRTADQCFVVEKNGTARLAHAVFVDGRESVSVVLRDDDDHGGVFDHMPTPSPTLTPFSEIIFVAEPNGCTHYGAPVMIASSSGTVSVVCRVARWPTLVRACDDSKKYLQYAPRPCLGWRKEAEGPDCSSYFAIERNGSTEVYNRILLASGDGVFLAYRAASNADLIVISDGQTVSVRCLVKRPSLSPDMDPVIIATEDCHSPNHLGMNILIPSPTGFIPVARTATVPRETKAKLQQGLVHDEQPLFLSWPHGQLCIQSHPHKCTTAATRTRLDRFASDLAGKVSHADRRPLFAPVGASRQRVIIGRLASAGTKSVFAAPAAWDGVVLGGDGPLKLGHSVIRLGYDSPHSDISFVPNDM
ncbi:hypothetical protein DIPPA_12034 [Diplonema papillatum]|nr:hypothetical protein DIPPA_12034 [Diplonema papillatum]